MKTTLNKTQTQQKIQEFFQQKDFKPEQLKKIKRLAMKFNIKLKSYKKHFCKKCLAPLNGKTRISKTHKTIICKNCQYKNRLRIN